MASIIDTDAKAIGEDWRGFGQNQIISLTSSNRLYAGHINESNLLEIHYSDDAGLNWTQEFTFGETVDSYTFSLCKSELDDVFVHFYNGVGTATRTQYVKKRDHTTGTWSNVLTNTNMTTLITSNHVGAMCHYNRNINRLYVIYFYSYGSGGGHILLAGQYSDDKGATWSGQVNIYDQGTSGSAYSVYLWGIDSDINTGNLTVLLGTNTTSYGIAVARVINSSLAYLSAEATPGNYYVYGGGVVVDSSGNRYVLEYHDDGFGNNYNLFIYRSNTRTTLVTNTTEALQRGYFSIGCDNSDNIYVFYVKHSDNKCYYRMRNVGTGTWGSEIALATGGFRPSCNQHSKPSTNKLNFVFCS
jgi:hypothetical protein